MQQPSRTSGHPQSVWDALHMETSQHISAWMSHCARTQLCGCAVPLAGHNVTFRVRTCKSASLGGLVGSGNLLGGWTDSGTAPQPRGIARRAAARTPFLSRAPPLEQAIAEQQHSAGKWGSLNSASLPGSGSACEAGCKGKEAFSGERLGTLWEGHQGPGVQYPHHSGPRTSQCGPGSNSPGEAATPPR